MLCYFSRGQKREDPSQHANCVLRGPLKQAHHLGGLSTCKLRAERGPEAASNSVSEPPNTQIACWEGSGGGPESRLWASQHANCMLRGVCLQSLALLATSLSNLFLVAPWQTICISLHLMWQGMQMSGKEWLRLREWMGPMDFVNPQKTNDYTNRNVWKRTRHYVPKFFNTCTRARWRYGSACDTGYIKPLMFFILCSNPCLY